MLRRTPRGGRAREISEVLSDVAMVTAARLTAVIVFRTGSRNMTRPANELSLSCQQGFGLASMFEECAEAKTIVQRFELGK